MKLRSEDLHERARIYMAMCGPSVSYAEAVRFAVEDAETGGEPLQFAAADSKSLELHFAVKKLIEEETAAGRFISYLDAVRRVEQERSKRRS